MTPAERARQIDQEEFRRDSEQALARALAYADQKRAVERARVRALEIRGILTGSSLVSHSDPMQPMKRAKGGTRTCIRRSFRKADCTTVTADGKTLTIRQWAKRLNLALNSLAVRKARLGSWEAAIAAGPAHSGKQTRKNPAPFANPIAPIVQTEYEARRKSYREWADELGISHNTFCKRVSRLGSLVAAINLGPAHRQGGRGVVSDFEPSIGTGGGSTAQESAKITFPEKAITE